MDNLNICCNIDDNYAPACGVMLSSLFEHNKGAKFKIHILHSKLSDENKINLNEIITAQNSECHFHTVDDTLLEGVRLHRENRPLTKAAYYRILLSSVLDKSVSKVLYLDSDLIVCRDITALFSLNLKGYALAATRDIGKLMDERRMPLSISYHKHYFASGLMLVNLDYWRENNSEKDLIAASKMEDRFLDQFDQDSLNAVFHDHWFELSVKWLRNYPYVYERSFFENRTDRKEFEENPATVHFLDYYKPWNKIVWFGIRWNKYRDKYYYYLQKTPWSKTHLQRAKLKLAEYKKLGLYIYLFKYSVNSLLNDINYFLSFKITAGMRKLIFMPLYLSLKLYYQVRKFIISLTTKKHQGQEFKKNEESVQ